MKCIKEGCDGERVVGRLCRNHRDIFIKKRRGFGNKWMFRPNQGNLKTIGKEVYGHGMPFMRSDQTLKTLGIK
jgi:hypothetical protein